MMTRPRLGVDRNMLCEGCARPVWMSAVTRWPTAHRLYWFLTGLCRECQKSD